MKLMDSMNVIDKKYFSQLTVSDKYKSINRRFID